MNAILARLFPYVYLVDVESVSVFGRYRGWTMGPYPFRWVADIVAVANTVGFGGVSKAARVVPIPRRSANSN